MTLAGWGGPSIFSFDIYYRAVTYQVGFSETCVHHVTPAGVKASSNLSFLDICDHQSARDVLPGR